jgi:hypothetical protein
MVGGSLRVLGRLPPKTGRHDIAEILLKVALKHQKSNKKKPAPHRGNKKILIPTYY